MTVLVDIVYLLAAIAYGPVLAYRMVRYGRYRKGWADRFGKIFRRDPALRRCIWLHAVSVGEVNAAKTIIQELRSRFSQYDFVLTATTDTGFARATEVFGGNLPVFYFPLDFSWIMRRAFTNIQPSLCLLMEQEVWPNFVQIANRLKVPVVVVNGRISDKGLLRYKKILPLSRWIYQKVNLVLTQTDEYAGRFVEIGCPPQKIIVTGSLKYDTAQIVDAVEGADELAKQLKLKNQRLWVAGATGSDEEQVLLDVYQQLKQNDQFKDLRLVIVPRKPERFDEVAQLIEQRGLPFVRYSRIKNSDEAELAKLKTRSRRIKADTIILGDTMGDLRKFYSLATVIFVGRSLVPMGGSDMMEAAALGKPTIFGPHTFNFKQTVDVLLEGQGAILVNDKEQLLQALAKCLTDPDYAGTIARNGQDIIRKNQGATQKTIDQIAKFLNKG
jgi:3-deoxy-D-manno-octulosonic-acid transferase